MLRNDDRSIKMTVKIAEVTIDDLKMLQHLSRRTFDETFRPQNTPENMAAYQIGRAHV